uniref:Uncharacterized protein n=1 Tax=Meloidogyne enterolobii TaxID=390850 RepID=A0A6V7VUH5_MELEN|nr:unnamed protein product [Meloidogyne enterolobii]
MHGFERFCVLFKLKKYAVKVLRLFKKSTTSTNTGHIAKQKKMNFSQKFKGAYNVFRH